MKNLGVRRLTKICELCSKTTPATHILIQERIWTGTIIISEVCESHAHEHILKMQGYS